MLLPPPQPGPTAFHQLLTDPSGSYTRHLSIANAARARVRTVLKATRKAASSGAGADWAAVVKATEDYIPYVLALIACVEADDLIPKSELYFLWRFSLTSQQLRKSRTKISLRTLHAELAAVLFTHALAIANRSAVIVASLGSYETSSSVSSSGIKTRDETINMAADLLCRASGVLSHIAEVVIPRWEAVVGESANLRPVELSRDVVLALSNLFLADANLLAIRRLLSKALSVAHTTTTPGPPLSSSHPSPSLLAKLHLHVYRLYDEARSLCKTASRGSDSQGEIAPELRRYLSDGRLIAQSLSYKWLGIDAGENGGRERCGECLGYLQMAKSAMEEVAGKTTGLKALKIGKGKSSGKERKGKVGEEVDSIAAFYAAYKKVNDTVHFQPIPDSATLQAQQPSGRAALATKSYRLPPPAFPTRGGLSPQAVPPPVIDLAMGDLDLNDNSSDEDDDGKAGQYFGAGSYW